MSNILQPVNPLEPPTFRSVEGHRSCLQPAPLGHVLSERSRSSLPNGVRMKLAGLVSATTPKPARARKSRHKAVGSAPHTAARCFTVRSSSPRASGVRASLSGLRTFTHFLSRYDPH